MSEVRSVSGISLAAPGTRSVSASRGSANPPRDGVTAPQLQPRFPGFPPDFGTVYTHPGHSTGLPGLPHSSGRNAGNRAGCAPTRCGTGLHDEALPRGVAAPGAGPHGGGVAGGWDDKRWWVFKVHGPSAIHWRRVSLASASGPCSHMPHPPAPRRLQDTPQVSELFHPDLVRTNSYGKVHKTPTAPDTLHPFPHLILDPRVPRTRPPRVMPSASSHRRRRVRSTRARRPPCHPVPQSRPVS